MTNANDKNNPERLYRRYQETRDNIPISILAALRARTQEIRNEESIHAILQAAKVHSNQLSENPAKNQAQARDSWFTSLKSKIGFITQPQYGAAFACLALVLVSAPFILDRQSSNYSEVAHLSDCQQCGVYLSNATANTRSANIGLNQLSLATKTAAKLGKISAQLKIESLNNSEQAITAALAALEKLPKSAISFELEEILRRKPNDLAPLSAAITNASQVASVTQASEALLIANVSIRHAAQLNRIDDAKPMFENAVTAFSSLAEPTILQKNSLAKLKEALSKPLDISVIQTIEAASKSLGG